MRTLFILLMSFVFCKEVKSQFAMRDSIAFYINQLNDENVRVEGDWSGCYLSLVRDTIATSLIKIGKPYTQALLDVLADSTKAIIANEILVKIWKRDGFIRMIFLDGVGDEHLSQWRDLFLSKHGKSMYATKESMYQNKLNWYFFLKSKNFKYSLFRTFGGKKEVFLKNKPYSYS